MRWLAAPLVCIAASACYDWTVRAGGDAGADATVDGGDAGPTPDGGCPGTAGPEMVNVGTFCIDSTEVTNAQYFAFLDAGAPRATMPAICASNTDFRPHLGSEYAFGPNLPVVWVTYCDAWAFCAWAGKRLCGRIGGGSLEPAAGTDPGASEWLAACSHGGAHAYAYGDAYDASACNGPPVSGAGALLPVRSLPTCVGGYPGLFDMNGNAGEIEDSCGDKSDGGRFCLVRGGSWERGGTPADKDPQIQSCALVPGVLDPWDVMYSDVGFRCCAP